MSNSFRVSVLSILAVFCSLSANSQNRQLTMEDVVLKSKTALAPDNLEQLEWVKGTDNYSLVKKINNQPWLVTYTSGGAERPLVSLSGLNASGGLKGADSLQSVPDITWTSAGSFVFDHKGSLYEYQVKTKNLAKVSRLPGPAMENADRHSPKGPIAVTLENNIWIFKGNDSIRVTAETDPAIICGHIVHREEFGIHKGTFWSPKGNFLAFYRMDESMVTQYPILNIDEPPATAKMIRYPIAGDKSHHVTIGIYNLATGQTVFLKTGEPADQYLTNICWSPDETSIYVAVLNRGQDHMKLNRYNAATGGFEATLFEEKDPKYVQPLNPMVFTSDGSKFLWQSRLDGYNHLYLFDKNGKLIRQLTKGNWEVTSFIGFNEDQSKAFFISTAEKPINRDIYAVELNTGKIKRISNGDGVHKAMVSSTGKYIIDEYSGPGNPRVIQLCSQEGKVVRELLRSKNPLAEYAAVDLSVFTITNEKGTELYCRMFRPAVLEPGKQYPTIVYVYGGPNIQLITNTWTGGSDLWPYYMAQRGFIVFTLDNRGTANRGKEFEQATFRQLGTAEREDQLAGIKYLLNQKYVDRNRMGIYGWSYGGFMSASMMTRNPGIFKAAVAGGPVIDWRLYEVMYTERYMDTPGENKQGYFETSLLNYVSNLKGKMMLIHGTSDNVVIWQHSLLYVREAVNKNVQVDYFVYPGHEHNVRGKDRVHLLNKVSEYFFENLNK